MKPRALFSTSPVDAVVPLPARPTLTDVPQVQNQDQAVPNARFSPPAAVESEITIAVAPSDDNQPATSATFALQGAIAQVEAALGSIAALNAEKEVGLQAQAEAVAEIASLKAQVASLQNDLDEASIFIEEMEAYNAKNQPSQPAFQPDDATARFHQDLEEMTRHFESQVGELEWQNEQTESLLQQFGPLCDLRLKNLPARILEAACAVIGAEAAILTDATAMDSVALRGVGEFSPRVAYELFEFTQSVRNAKSSITENKASKTPAGCDFSNLIALPFAPDHEGGGVLLLANKRDGDFTPHDAHLLALLEKQITIALENDRLYLQREELFNDTVAVLADAIETKDPYVRGHCESLMRLAVDVGKRFDLNAEQLDEVRLAALLHDIGKIGVPDNILLKTGKLTDEEQTIVRQHPSVGYDLVFHVPSLQWLANGILHHHENWDGTGYPEGLAGKEIPLAARIVGAVDAFDAMTTPRLYRQAISAGEALDEMKRCAGTQFDPAVVEALQALMQEGQKTQEHAAERIEKAATPRPRPRRDALKRSAAQSNVALMNREDEDEN